MLESEEVDEGYFTPVVSTTLANIFKDEAGNEQTVNASLKYKPPQPKKSVQIPKPEDPNVPECVFSCSLIAYEWIQGTHKCKGKVGFAIMRTINDGLCKMILYSPDKSTLSCTTMTPQLEVTLKEAMVSLYDDRKKYWGLCFNDKIINKVINLLQNEKVIIKNYESPQPNNSTLSKSDVESQGSYENIDEPDNKTEVNASTPRNDKASILSRIANVGQAILPSVPSSPVKKTTISENLNSTESCNSNEKVILRDTESNSEILLENSKSTANENNTGAVLSNANQTNNVKPMTSILDTNNQVLHSIEAAMQMNMPVSNKLESSNTASCTCVDLEVILTKLTHLQGLVKNMESVIKNTQSNQKETKTVACNSDTSAKILNQLENNLTDIISEVQNKQTLRKLSELEELIKEKNDVILKLQTELKQEIKKTSDAVAEQNRNTIYMIREQIKDLKQDLTVKNEEINSMKIKSEADNLVARTLKKVMNDTYHSLASNFEDNVTYSGYDIKSVLMVAIKKNTVESLSTLTGSHDL